MITVVNSSSCVLGNHDLKKNPGATPLDQNITSYPTVLLLLEYK